MKKILLGIGVCFTFVVSLSSCTKETCYTCTLNSTPACTIDICDRQVTASSACNGVNYTSKSNEALKVEFEKIGFTCTAK